MANNKMNSRTLRRSLARAWPMVSLTFAAVLFGLFAMEWDPAQAQEAPRTKTKTTAVKKGEYAPTSKSLSVAASLTKGQKVDTAALARLIDQEINKRLQAEKVKSSGLCDDAEFIRRIYLDLVGVIPNAEKVSAFLGSKEPNKRAQLIDELLADTRYGHALAEAWVNHMIPRESNNRVLNQKPLETWMAENFNKNTPLNKVIYDLLTVSGEVDKNPAGTYFVGNPSVDKITDNVTRMFLGVQLQCAQCHNHPFTDWKQTEYWAMAAFFMKTRVNATPQAAAKKGIPLSVMETNKAFGKKNALPESAKIVPAKFLQGEQPKIQTTELRPVLATWMTSADNKFFARAMVNRFWYQLFGRGIVNPVDDMHDDNAPTHPELLATLTEQFKLHDFDVKYLLRAICNSEVYQRSSVSQMESAAIDPELYIRRELRVLTPEQMFDSLALILGKSGATAVETKGLAQKKGGQQSPRSNFISFFRVDEANPLEYQIGIPQALLRMNAPFTKRADVIVAEITKTSKTPAQAIEQIYVTVLSRRPTERELDRLTAYVGRADSTVRSSYGDILWALMNSSEFTLNH